MQFPVLYESLPQPIANPNALNTHRWREALALSARGNLSRANKQLVEQVQSIRQQEEDLTCSITDLVKTADERKNKAIRRLMAAYVVEKERNRTILAEMDQFKIKTRARMTELIAKRQRDAEVEHEAAKRRIIDLEEQLASEKQKAAAAAAVAAAATASLSAGSASTSKSGSGSGNNIECTICMSAIVEPYIGTCGHMFCKKCTKSSISHYKSNYRSMVAQHGADSDIIYNMDEAMESAEESASVLDEINNEGPLIVSNSKSPLPMPSCPVCRKPGAFYRAYI